MNAASGPVAGEDAGDAALEATCPGCAGERSTSTSSRADSALTTEAPTPCRPPVATYEPPPNLPPACSLVKTTSTPGSPVLGSLSTGMPRPSSCTSAEPSGCSVTSIAVRGAGQRLVDAVVDDLPQAVHEPAGVGGADVHARALADRLEPLEDQEVWALYVLSMVVPPAVLRAGTGLLERVGLLPNLLATRRRADSPRLPACGTAGDHGSARCDVTMRQRVVSSPVDWQPTRRQAEADWQANRRRGSRSPGLTGRHHPPAGSVSRDWMLCPVTRDAEGTRWHPRLR